MAEACEYAEKCVPTRGAIQQSKVPRWGAAMLVDMECRERRYVKQEDQGNEDQQHKGEDQGNEDQQHKDEKLQLVDLLLRYREALIRPPAETRRNWTNVDT